MTDPRTGLSQEVADDALLQQLAQALRPPPLTPSPASLEALRQAVEQKWRPTGRGRVIGQLAAWARRLQRSGAALAVLGGVVAGGTGVALAANRTIPPVRYTLHDLGIPVLSWAADHHGDGRPASSSVKAGPEAAPSTPPRGTEPATAPAVLQVLLAPGRLTGRDASGAATAERRSWSVPAPSASDPRLAGSWRSTPATDRTMTPGGCRACAWAGAALAEPRATSPTPWSRLTPTTLWPTAPCWSHPRTGGFTNGGSVPQATRGSSGSPPYQTTRQSRGGGW